MEELVATPVWEVMTQFNTRSTLGRVTVNPPKRMAPLVTHKTGEAWFICKKCGYATLAKDKMVVHNDNHAKETEECSDEDDDEPDDVPIGDESDGDEDMDVLEFKDDIINKKKDRFECHICHKRLVTLKGLRNHHLIHQDVRPFKCKICLASFKRSNYLAKHQKRSHNDSFGNKCPKCPCSFEKEAGLRKHFGFYHDLDEASSLPAKTSPAKVRSNDQPKISTVADELREHKATKPYISRDSTVSSKASKHHLIRSKIHLSDEMIAKKLVGVMAKAKVKKAILKSRAPRKTESVLSSRYCNLCNKYLSSKTKLKYHQMVHRGERPFKCEMCPNSYVQNCELLLHIRKVHSSGTYTCYYCSGQFTSRDSRERHCASVHPGQVNQDMEYFNFTT